MAVPVAPNIIPFFVRVFVCSCVVTSWRDTRSRACRGLTVHGTAGRVVQTIIRDSRTTLYLTVCVSQSSELRS